jgi:hypothetical protein
VPFATAAPRVANAVISRAARLRDPIGSMETEVGTPLLRRARPNSFGRYDGVPNRAMMTAVKRAK